jgi:uncharacterized protein YlaI
MPQVECEICLESINQEDAFVDKGIDLENEDYEVFLCESCKKSNSSYRSYLIDCDIQADY